MEKLQYQWELGGQGIDTNPNIHKPSMLHVPCFMFLVHVPCPCPCSLSMSMSIQPTGHIKQAVTP